MTRTSVTIVMGLAATACAGPESTTREPPQGPRCATRYDRDTCRPPNCRTAPCRPSARTATSSSGATHPPSPDMAADQRHARGTVHALTMNSIDSKLYPGIAREQGTRGEQDPSDPASSGRHDQPSSALHAP